MIKPKPLHAHNHTLAWTSSIEQQFSPFLPPEALLDFAITLFNPNENGEYDKLSSFYLIHTVILLGRMN